MMPEMILQMWWVRVEAAEVYLRVINLQVVVGGVLKWIGESSTLLGVGINNC